MFRLLTAAGVAAGALLAGASCAAEAQVESVDRLTACELISAADVAAAMGGEVSRPQASDDAGGADALAGRTGCAWASRDGSTAALFELVRTEDMANAVRRTGFSATARYNAAQARHAESRPTDVGDRGFWVDDTATLHVLVSRSYLVVEVATPAPRDAEPLAIRLASLAVDRLTAEQRAD